ncbi:MAG: hypothetical protein ACRDYU_06070 [Actinomycetes bacterium]
MPRGAYRHLDETGTTVLVERFSCAAGPSGWRYNAELRDPEDAHAVGAVDVVVDASWLQVAVSLRSGGVSVQGGLSGAELVWARTDGTSTTEGQEPAAAFAGTTPGLLVAVARLLGLSRGHAARARVVRVTPPTLQPEPIDETWALTDVTTYETDVRPLRVERYEVTGPGDVDPRVLHLAGDVVLDAPRLALEELDTPPTPGG